MAKVFILTFVFMALVAQNLSEAARNKNRPRKNRQSKRQKNSETSLNLGDESRTESTDCMDLNKKVLRMKYETGINGTNLSGLAMLPTPAQPTYRGITFPSVAPARAGTCPHALQENFDGNRWPRMIMENRCSCSQCNLRLRPPGDEATCPEDENPSDENPEGYCRPIMRDIAVLRRAGCVGDFARYEWDVVNVSVGCECVIGVRPIS